MITHYRVDMRVVHGQTVTILKKSFPLNRIIVIDDGIAKDKFMVNLYASVVPSFLLIYFGAGAVESVANLLPPAIVAAFSAVAKFLPAIVAAFSAVAKFLPAIGMAALMGYLVEDVWGIVFFLFGFACYEYLGLSTTGIIFIAIIVAYFYYRTMGRPQKVAVGADDEEEII